MRSFLVASLLVGCFLATIAHKQRRNLRSVQEIIQNHPECSSIGTPVALVHCGQQTTCDFPNEVCVAVDDEEESHSHNIPSESTVAVPKKQQKVINHAHEANEATRKTASLEEQTENTEEATYEAAPRARKIGKAKETSQEVVSAPKAEQKTKVSPSIGNSPPHPTEAPKEVAHETVTSTRKSKKKKVTQDVVSTSQKEENDEEAYGAAPSPATDAKPKKIIQKVTSQPKKVSSQEDIPEPKKQQRTKPATQEVTPSTGKIHKPKTTSHKQVTSSHKETITNDQESSYNAGSATADESRSQTSERVASKSQKTKTISHESVATQGAIKPRPAAAREETKSTIIKTSHVVAKAPLLTKKVSHEEDEAEKEVKYVRGEGSTADDDSTKIPPLIRDGIQHRTQLPNQATATRTKQQQNPNKETGSQGCPKLCTLKQNQHRPYCARRRCNSAPEEVGYNARYYAALTNVCGGCSNGEYGGICPRACRTKRNEPKKIKASICIPVPPACRKFFTKPAQTQKVTPAETQPHRNLNLNQKSGHQEKQQSLEQQPPSPISQPHIALQQQGYEQQTQQQQQSHVAPLPQVAPGTQAAQPQPQQQPHEALQHPAAPQPQQEQNLVPSLATLEQHPQQQGHNQPPVHQESSAKLSVSVLQPAKQGHQQQKQPQPHQQPLVAPQIPTLPHPQAAVLQQQQGSEQQQQSQQQPHVAPQAPVVPQPQVAPLLQQQQGYGQQPHVAPQISTIPQPQVALPQPQQEYGQQPQPVQHPQVAPQVPFVPHPLAVPSQPQQQGYGQQPLPQQEQHVEPQAPIVLQPHPQQQSQHGYEQQPQPGQNPLVASQVPFVPHPQAAPFQPQQPLSQQEPHVAPQAPIVLQPHPQQQPHVAPQISTILQPQVAPPLQQQQGYGQQLQLQQQPHVPLQNPALPQPHQEQNLVPPLATLEQHPQQQGHMEPSEQLKSSAKLSVSVLQPAQQDHQQQQPQKATQVTTKSKALPKESSLQEQQNQEQSHQQQQELQTQPPHSPNHGKSRPSPHLSPPVVSDKVPEQNTSHQQSTEDKHVPIKPKLVPLNAKQVEPGYGAPESVPVQEEESHSQDSHLATGSKAVPSRPAASVPEAEPPEKGPETHIAHPVPQPEPEPQPSHPDSQQGGYNVPQLVPAARGPNEQSPPHGAQVQNGHDGAIIPLPNPQVQRQSVAVSTGSHGGTLQSPSLPGTPQQQAHGSNAPAASSFPSAIVYRKQTGDYHLHCCLWAKLGKCTEDARFMCTVCQHSCGTRGCTDETYRSFTPRPTFDSCPW